MAVNSPRGGPSYSSAAVGWISFAGVMLMLVGMFQVFAGIAGIANDEGFLAAPRYTYSFDTTEWGWTHLILGVIVVLAGVGLFSGNLLARTVAVVIAVLSAMASFLWIPYYPLWAIVIIAIDVSIIWALTAHGRDLANME